MARAARGAGWALTVTAEPAAVTMPDKAKGIARRVDGGLSLKQAMGLLVAGLAMNRRLAIGIRRGIQRAAQSQAALVVDNIDLASEIKAGSRPADDLDRRTRKRAGIDKDDATPARSRAPAVDNIVHEASRRLATRPREDHRLFRKATPSLASASVSWH